MSIAELLRVRDLRVDFRTYAGTVRAVRGIDIDLAVGETLGIVGESGCGKSASMLAVAGLLPREARVTYGDLSFDGRDVGAMSGRALRRLRGTEVAMIFQDPMTSLNPTLSIRVQLTEHVVRHLDLSVKEARDRAVEMLDLVGIPNPTERLCQYPHEFSGGMRQRVMISDRLDSQPLAPDRRRAYHGVGCDDSSANSRHSLRPEGALRYEHHLRCILSMALATIGIPSILAGGGQEDAAPEQTLSYNLVNELGSVDPGLATGVDQSKVNYALFEGLVKIGPELNVVPGVAERWDVSADGLVYTFHLREEARWSDGEAVTSRDFVWSWLRSLDPATASRNVNDFFSIKNAEAPTTGVRLPETTWV